MNNGGVYSVNFEKPRVKTNGSEKKHTHTCDRSVAYFSLFLYLLVDAHSYDSIHASSLQEKEDKAAKIKIFIEEINKATRIT